MAMAVVFSALLVAYTAIWLYYAGWTPRALLGVQWKAQLTPYVTLKSVVPGSSADRAGLKLDDRILAVDGYPQHIMTLAPAISRGKPGNVVTLSVQRPGVPQPFDVQVALEAAPPTPPPTTA